MAFLSLMAPFGLSFFGTSLLPFAWSNGLISDVVEAIEAMKRSISKLHGPGLARQSRRLAVKLTSTAWVGGGHTGQEASLETVLLAESRLSPGVWCHRVLTISGSNGNLLLEA